MSVPKDNDAPATQQNGVLSNLPRTRPQRASARRAAARKANAAPAAKASAGTKQAAAPGASAHSNGRPPAGAGARPAPAAKAGKSKAGTTKAGKSKARASAEPVPRQGFECEERASGAVHPPGGRELIASAAELAGELAKAGASTGERVLKDVLSRLPLP